MQNERYERSEVRRLMLEADKREQVYAFRHTPVRHLRYIIEADLEYDGECNLVDGPHFYLSGQHYDPDDTPDPGYFDVLRDIMRSDDGTHDFGRGM